MHNIFKLKYTIRNHNFSPPPHVLSHSHAHFTENENIVTLQLFSILRLYLSAQPVAEINRHMSFKAQKCKYKSNDRWFPLSLSLPLIFFHSAFKPREKKYNHAVSHNGDSNDKQVMSECQNEIEWKIRKRLCAWLYSISARIL